jgi:hypothetical protein
MPVVVPSPLDAPKRASSGACRFVCIPDIALRSAELGLASLGTAEEGGSWAEHRLASEGMASEGVELAW